MNECYTERVCRALLQRTTAERIFPKLSYLTLAPTLRNIVQVVDFCEVEKVHGSMINTVSADFHFWMPTISANLQINWIQSLPSIYNSTLQISCILY